MLKRKELKFKNIIHYIVGNYRYWRFKSKFKSIRFTNLKEYHIDQFENCLDSKQEQFLYRITLVQKESPVCLSGNECFCGCDTLEMLMSDKTCGYSYTDKKFKCYPDFMTDQVWEVYKEVHNIDMLDILKQSKQYL